MNLLVGANAVYKFSAKILLPGLIFSCNRSLSYIISPKVLDL